jgi:hypothetical protein
MRLPTAPSRELSLEGLALEHSIGLDRHWPLLLST